MQVTRKDISETEVELTITADTKDLEPIKTHVLTEHFADSVTVPGFRAGKAPANLIEKALDPSVFQNRFLEEVINELFVRAVNKELVRTVDQPEVQIKKFVPYSTLEFVARVPILGKIVIPDYKKIKLAKPRPKLITAKDIDDVIKSIQKQISDKKDVNRAAKDGDQVFIDFKGTDGKGKPVSGADAKEYPLVLGSKAFIPGFEENIVGLKAGDNKKFQVTFPKDYQLKALANKKVDFVIDVIKVQEMVEPKLDDEFAKKAGPFQTMADLKTDIKRQLTLEEENKTERDYESLLVKNIADKSKLNIPEILVNGEVEKRLNDLRRNLTYRGQTFEEFLGLEGMSEAEYIEKELKPGAIDRLKGSLILSEISETEKIDLTNEEIDAQMEYLKTRYTDPETQAELAKPEARRDIASRLLAEKTIKKLVEYASK